MYVVLVDRVVYIALLVALTDRYHPPTVPATPLIVYVLASNCNGDPTTHAANPDTAGP